MNSDNKEPASAASARPGRRFNAWQVSTFILLAILLTLATIWLASAYLFPSEFKPVSLSSREQQVLDEKLERFQQLQSQADRRASRSRPFSKSSEGVLEPEPYSEEGASREIHLSERELNALLARNTDLATRLAIDLADNLASAKLLVHLDEDFPLLGGNTIKLTAGAELAYAGGNPVVKLRGVSIWGVPIPNAWLGGIKNVDLIQEFGQEPGFWKAFADGVDAVEVRQGQLLIRLKE